ncbi:MAG: hypothetical protein HKO63_11180 [Acidimicrobiia bacterium]|nr:hypothetical protein [Acidimicrobiia bacterium]MBT8194089.1 hypothetical protein [Acidimicrobiia bacterium]MBT8246214.1 hypothetical protein [Acidimicrobiia bacterium]NNF88966.1 hypothetical protein [Acidimicrobiia bacterium]NNJ48113.1 hypothetical protein [Acidimicrobiia bacterium]
MKRFAALVFVLVSLAVPAHAVTVVPSVAAQQAQDGPAIVIDDSGDLPEEEAWTFRFLVPTLMVMALAMVVGLVVWYQRGLNSRYRIRDAE